MWSRGRLTIESVFILICVAGLREAQADHELVITTSISPSSIATADLWVWWTEGADDPEFCPVGGEVAIRRVSAGGGEVTTLYSQPCDPAGDFRPDFIQTDGVHVYYSSGSSIDRLWALNDENRSPSYPPETLRVTTGEVRALVLDDSYVYWSELSVIKRIPKNGGTLEFIANFNEFDGSLALRGLAVDDTHVFFLTVVSDPPEGAVYKKNKDGSGVVTELAFSFALDDLKYIGLDDENVYFTELNDSPVQLRVLRTPKIPDVVDELGVVAGPFDDYQPTGLAIDDTYAFWSDHKTGELEVDRVGRAEADPGGPPVVDETFVALLTFPTDVVVDADYAYFSATEGGDITGDGVPDATGPGIYRKEKDAPPKRVNLKWVGMEVTQGIQDMSNDVKLASDKQTLVRVYPTADLSDVYDVRAVLAGKRVDDSCAEAGVPLPGSPLSATVRRMDIPVRAHMTGGVVDLERLNLDLSFNFWLPGDWTDGKVCLTPQLDADGDIIESNEADNDTLPGNPLGVLANFRETEETCIVVRPIDTRNVGNYTTRSTGFWNIIDRYETLWPTPQVNIYEYDTPMQELELCPWPCWGPYESDNLSGFGSKVMLSLAEWWAWSDDPDECDIADSAVHYVGMVNSNASTGDVNGYSYLEGPNVSWVKMEFEPNTGAPFGDPPAGGTFAQETSHNYWTLFVLAGGCLPLPAPNWEHVDCGGPPDIEICYPYCDCQLDCSPCGPCGNDVHFGYDRVTDTVIPPDTAADYMSYRRPAWVSDYHWEGMIDELSEDGRAAAGRAARARVGGEMLLVSGIVTPGAVEQAEFVSFRLPPGAIGAAKLAKLLAGQTSYTPPDAAHALELVNGLGDVIFTQPFDPPHTSQHFTDIPESFPLLIPYDPATAMIRIMHEGIEIGARDVSLAVPTVSISEPGFGDVIVDTLTVVWDGFDADAVDLDDALLYVVQYSPNFGLTWQSLVTRYPSDIADAPMPNGTTVLTLSPIASLPGSKGTAPGLVDCHQPTSLIRVIATDGVNTATAISEPFRVECRPPAAHITTPRDGSSFAHTDQIVLSGRSMDPEEGSVQASSLVWTVVPGGMAGTGRDVILYGLPPGTYDIVLTAVDQQGMTGSDQVTIEVGAVRAPRDSDADGYADLDDNCPYVANADQADMDADGTGDLCDNCPSLPNAGQADSDGDDLGDDCDGCPYDYFDDADGDGFCADLDNCPDVPNPIQEDTDQNGVGDACDAPASAIPWHSLDCGGTTFSLGGIYKLGGTIGQHDAGTMSGGIYTSKGGFWHGGLTAPPPPGPGDCDGDGDVDLTDYATFGSCLTGPAAPVSFGCECADLDQNGRVDLRDFAELQAAFTG